MIDAVHWDVLAIRTLGAFDAGFSQFVVWPAPVQHDSCLAQAGFERFSDAAGDEANPFALRVVRCLTALGELRVRGGERWATREPVSWWDRMHGRVSVRRTAAESLADAAENDDFPPCVVDVVGANHEIIATVVSSDGHPVFWIGLRQGDSLSVEKLITCVAAGLPTHKTSLRWDLLIPTSLTAAPPQGDTVSR